MSLTQNKALPTIGLIAVTAVWGSTFFLLKDLVQQMPPLDFLGVRFGLAGLLIAIFQFGRLRKASRGDWIRGSILAAIYAGGQLLQTIGLQYTDASISGFITGMYLAFTPILLAILFKQKVSGRAWMAVGIATVGLGFLSLQGFAFGFGESVTLVSAVFYALHIVFLARWAHRSDPVTLGAIQLVGMGVIFSVTALPSGVVLPSTPGAWASLLYMAVISGLAAMMVQTWAQSKLNATTAAVIMSFEPVFAAFFAILFGGEQLTVRLLVGGSLILGAMLLIESGGSSEAKEVPEESLPQPEEAPLGILALDIESRYALCQSPSYPRSDREPGFSRSERDSAGRVRAA